MINLLEDYSSYAFIKAILAWVIGGLLLGCFCYGYSLLRKDNYQLVKVDEVRLYIIAFAQLLVLTLNWAVVEMSFLEYPSRILKFVLNISVTVSFLYYILDEVYTNSIEKAFKFSISSSIVLLVFMMFDKKVFTDSGENFWELYDLLYALSTGALLYVGCRAISDITAVENQNLNQASDPIAKQISLQLIRKDKSNFFFLVTGILFGCVLYIFMDFMKFYEVDTQAIMGGNFFVGRSLTFKITMAVIDLVANCLPIVTIYYIFVARNLSLLDYNVQTDASVHDACDSLRSQMILEIEMEEQNKQKAELARFDLRVNF